MRGIYIHIPFCEKKCAYCDFLSFPGKQAQRKPLYMQALIREMESRIRGDWQRPDTILIGGGTPSSLSCDALATLLEALHGLVDMRVVKEFTVEANPGTVDREKLTVLRNGGVNRLSFGVQSFDDRLLAQIGRMHTAREAQEAIDLAHSVGFININLDLMYGLPGQTFEVWQASINTALKLAPEHLSLYQLIVEPGTAIARGLEEGRLPPIDEDGAAVWFDWQRGKLSAAGYDQYEISNYAKNGYASLHNQLYWHLDEYLGLGLGATSWERPVRSKNTEDMHTYLQAQKNAFQALSEREVLGKQAQMSESIFMALRMNEGVSLEQFFALYGASVDSIFPKAVEEGGKKGWLVFADGHLKLTDLGRRYGNAVFELFI